LRGNAQTAPNAPLVLHCTKISKFSINDQLQNKLLLIVIYHFSLVKARIKAPRICKLHKNYHTGIEQCAMVLSNRLNFFCFPIAKGVTKTRPLRTCQLLVG
jgi:hypothetical protein